MSLFDEEVRFKWGDLKTKISFNAKHPLPINISTSKGQQDMLYAKRLGDILERYSAVVGMRYMEYYAETPPTTIVQDIILNHLIKLIIDNSIEHMRYAGVINASAVMQKAQKELTKQFDRMLNNIGAEYNYDHSKLTVYYKKYSVIDFTMLS